MRIKLVNIRVLRPIESGIARRIALFTLAVAAMSVLLLPGTAKAEWPERPTTVVVMYGAGGGTDTVIRTIAADGHRNLILTMAMDLSAACGEIIKLPVDINELGIQ